MPPESWRGYLSIACVEPQLREELARPRLDLLARQPANVGMQHDVGERGAEFEQQVVLERDADVGDRLRDGRAADDDVAAAALQQARDHQHQRALAASRRADDRHELAGLDFDADLLQREERLVGVLAERLRHAADADRHADVASPRRATSSAIAVMPARRRAVDAATAASGTFDTSSALRPRCTTASSWSTTSTSNVAIACVGRDLLSRSSAIR